MVRAWIRCRCSWAAAALMALSLPATAHAESGRGRASVGEGAQDLAGRIRIEAPTSFRPWAGLETHADVGPVPALLGPATEYYRIQPLMMVGLSPNPALEIFAGAGVGVAHVIEGVCSDGNASS